MLAINDSPDSSNYSVTILLEQFLAGAREAGAETEVVNTEELNIEACNGCTEDLEFKSNGKCKYCDDMEALYPKFISSEVWVFAMPNCIKTRNGSFINLLDRLEPLLQFESDKAFMSKLDFNHGSTKNGSIVFICSGKEWDKASFKPFIRQFDELSKLHSRRFAGAIIRQHDGAFEAFLQMGIPVDDILDAARDAGRQLVINGKISSDTFKIISRQLVPRGSLIHRFF